MLKSEKPQVVETLNAVFKQNSVVILTNQSGLTVAEVSDLRNKIRNVPATYAVTKNTLARIAIKGTPCEILDDSFKGPTAVAAANDPIAIAKVIADFAKTNDKIQIMGGVMDGRKLSAADVKALSALPSMDQLRATLIGLIQAPATKIAGVLQAPAGQLARVFAAYSKK